MQQTVLITCALGVVPALSAELRALGFEVIREQHAAVETRTDLAGQMRLLLHLRTAHRVLVPVLQCRAVNPQVLYYKIIKHPWETWLSADGYVRIHGHVRQEGIHDDRFALLKVKDAIMDRLRTQYGRRPDSGPGDHGASLYLHWVDNQATLSLDLAGRPLSKRGYRTQGGPAPMQEALAAAMLLTGGWTGDTPLVNPLCGSGTLGIEAAWIARRRAPGLLREHFGLFHLNTFDRDLWISECEAARQQERKPEDLPRIVMSDLHPGAIHSAKQGVELAGVADQVDLQVCDFRETPMPEGGAWIAINPPYGKRLEDEEAVAALYPEIGRWLKGLHTGGQALVITGNLSLAKRFGLKLSQKHTLYNGAMECRLLGFPLFAPGDAG
jgi:putative N6-adenine-specific DNA methylase